MNHPNLARRNFLRSATAIVAGSAFGNSAARAEAKSGEKWKMKLATSSVMFDRLPIEKVCERAVALGLQGLDIWAPFSWGGAKCTHLEDIRKRLGGNGLRELMASHKLELAAFSIYGHKLSQYWELIRDFGGGIVVRGAGSGKLEDPKQLVPRMRTFFEQLKPDIELAEKCDGHLAIENHGGSILDTPDSFKAFVEMNPDPKRVGIAVAPYHLQAYKTPIEDVIKTAGKQCQFFYAWQRGAGNKQMPGVGPVDFAPWVRALSHINYSRFSSIFMHGHAPADEMATAVAKSRKYLIEIRDQLPKSKA